MATSIFHKEMGLRISQRRKALGLTQEQLAERMDVSTQTVSYIETGRKAIRPENLAKLCSALQVSADYILLGKASDIDIGQLTQKIQRLSPEELDRIELILNSCIALTEKDSK